MKKLSSVFSWAGALCAVCRRGMALHRGGANAGGRINWKGALCTPSAPGN